MAKNLSVGDVLEIVAPDGLVYLQYLGKHPSYGDGVAVCPEKRRSRPALSPSLLDGSYVTFYPAAAAVRQGLADVVGHLPSSGLPGQYRRPGAREGVVIKTWILEDASGDHLRQTLSEDERRLPIASIWNHEYLLNRISAGWRPEQE